MSQFKELFTEIFRKNGLENYIRNETVEKFEKLTEIMIRTNAVMNITALTTIEKIIPLHYADCVVAALCSLSREKARVAVVNGLFEVDYEICERPDRTLTAPCTVTVKGYGKFRINSLCDKTKKGRLRLDADKYV